MRNVYIVNAVRTAVGTFGGSLKNTPATELGRIVMKEVLNRSGVSPDQVDEVFFGCVLTAGLGQNVARQCAVNAGIPVTTPATTISMVCGSGMKSIIEGVRAIQCGEAETVMAGGTENMSASPYCIPSARWGNRMFDTKMVDIMIKDGLWDAFNDYHMGKTAENIAEKWNITRQMQDEFSAVSQQRAEAAIRSGRFDDEIVPVPIQTKQGIVDFATDEHHKTGSTVETLSKLKPAFQKDGSVTAGSSSGINDGAAAVLLMSEDHVKELSIAPMAKILSYGQAGVDPSIMGIGPVYAVRSALKKANLKVSDIDLFESNEAFAAQSLAVAAELGLALDKVNVNGGAIALGHPIGASGSRILVTLLYEMKKRKAAKGVATLCIGGGMGTATVVEL